MLEGIWSHLQCLPQPRRPPPYCMPDRGPQPPAAGGVLPQAACKMAFDLPIRGRQKDAALRGELQHDQPSKKRLFGILRRKYI